MIKKIIYKNHFSFIFIFTLYICFLIINNGSVIEQVIEMISPLFFTLQVLNQTHDHRQRVLHNVAKELPNWAIMVRKMKAIYHTMNLFNVDVTKKCLIGECWVPVSDLTIVRDCLNEGSVGSSNFTFLFFFYFIITIDNYH